MDDQAVRSVPWTISTFVAQRAIPMLTTIVLARILAPSDFGLVAMAGVVMGVLGILVDFGMQNTIVMRRDLSVRAQGTVLSMMLLLSGGAAMLGAALSPVVALAYGEARVAPIMAALSGVFLVMGVNSFYDGVLQREMAFRSRFGAQMVNTAVYSVTVLVLALSGAGVWSLVIGQLLGAAACFVAMLIVVPYRVRPRFDRRTAADTFATSRGFLMQGGMAFLQQNADNAIVGRVLGPQALGFYSMAYRLGELPTLAISNPVARVTFSEFSRMREQGRSLGLAFLKVLRMVALVACPVGVIVSALAEPLVATVLGPQWGPAAGPIAVLGIWSAFYPVQNTLNWMINSVGRASLLALVSGVVLVFFLGGAVGAAAWAGTTAVAVAVLGRTVVTVVASAVLVRRHAEVGLRAQARALTPVAAGCIVAWPVAHFARLALEHEPAGLALVGGALAGGLAYVVAAVLMDRDLAGQTVEQLRRVAGRPVAPVTS